ncbi:MAG: NAD(P)/FAD-dependent oxidoreductase [Candidatus Falkowbacteria bacterium]
MIYDLAVVGGGPAGMIAAGRAGERGARVILLEKNDSLGIKLLLSGGGRCNFTNLGADDKAAMAVYGANHKFLFSAFHGFGVKSVLSFFSDLGVSAEAEEKGRVFPKSGRAEDIRRALLRYLEKNKVEIRYGAVASGLVARDNAMRAVRLRGGGEILSKNFLIATGGRSYPTTGSEGDAYGWLASLGHTVIPPRPALTPVVVREKIVKKLEGLSLKDAGLKVLAGKKTVARCRGDMVFTSDGLSGPAVIDLSGRIGSLLSAGAIKLEIDFFPDIKGDDLDKKLRQDFHESHNKQLKNYLVRLTSPRLAPVLLELSGLNGTRAISEIRKEERVRLAGYLKRFTLEVKGLKGFDRAMITAGGVATCEVDPKTMRSRLYPNLFFAGEALDLDGPSGGYNLQICWSTGFTAGDSVPPPEAIGL